MSACGWYASGPHPAERCVRFFANQTHTVAQLPTLRSFRRNPTIFAPNAPAFGEVRRNGLPTCCQTMTYKGVPRDIPAGHLLRRVGRDGYADLGRPRDIPTNLH